MPPTSSSITLWTGAIALAAATLGACASTPRQSGFDEEGDTPEKTGAPNVTSGSGAGNISGSPVADPTCAAVKQSAQKPKVDILIGIDSSGSMTAEIQQTKTNINAFAQSIAQSGLDYTVTMVAEKGTGSLEVCVPAPLGGTACADNAPTFHHVDVAIGSTDALSKFLTTHATYQSFLREDAHKVFVVITDDNQSSALSANSFDTQLLAKPGFGTTAKRNYTFHSIVGWQEGTARLSSQKCSTSENPGLTYQQLSELTGGLVDSVCKLDYSGVLNNVAKGIAAKLACEYGIPEASTKPVDPTKVVVQYTPVGASAQKLVQVTDASKCSQVTDGWYYDDNTKPTKVLLCKGGCDTVQTKGGQMELLLGCAAPAPR